jgi:hypothetical protein
MMQASPGDYENNVGIGIIECEVAQGFNSKEESLDR